jgi:Flp pilus assembly protein TadG
MKRTSHSEQGQVLILLTIGIITLLGFTALAIDGGRLYGERRHVQGVTDTSSLTGALYIAQYEGDITTTVKADAKNAALSRSASNGYSTGGDTNVEVTITHQGSYYYVETVISTAINPVIAQIVYNGPLNVSAKSVARVLKQPVFAFGNALYAISNDQKNAIEFTGSATIEIKGTGIYSNSNHSTKSVSFGGSSTTVLTHGVGAGGGINVAGTVENPDGTTFTDYSANAPQLGAPYVPTPDCSGLPAGIRTESGSEVNFTPGVYGAINESSHKTYTFEPGFYCINGGFTTANGTFIGDEGVTFYVSSGNVSLSGVVDFRAPTDGSSEDSSGHNWNGMLLYIATGRLTINGNSDSYYQGTAYVPTPGNPSCKLNGSSDSDGYQLQLVCDSININGDGTLVLTYDEANLYKPPVKIDLDQ